MATKQNNHVKQARRGKRAKRLNLIQPLLAVLNVAPPTVHEPTPGNQHPLVQLGSSWYVVARATLAASGDRIHSAVIFILEKSDLVTQGHWMQLEAATPQLFHLFFEVATSQAEKDALESTAAPLNLSMVVVTTTGDGSDQATRVVHNFNVRP